MAADETRWVIRLTPPAGRTVRDFFEIPLSLDVWQREDGALIAAAPEATVRELERRRLASVERLCTIAEYKENAGQCGQHKPE
jgi:hypothetical protein